MPNHLVVWHATGTGGEAAHAEREHGRGSELPSASVHLHLPAF